MQLTPVAQASVAALDPLKERFALFLFKVWEHLGLPPPTPVQLDIADHLQYGPKRAIIEAFRGVGKSFVTAAFVMWVLYCNPQSKVMVVSASKPRADEFSTFTQRVIAEMPMLAHLRPRPGQRDSKIAFDVGPAMADQSPSVKSVGIKGQLTGSRADVIVADDVEVPSNSMTQTERDKLATLVTEFDAVLKPLPTSRIIYLGTPQTEMTLYARLEQRGYKARIWPARYPKPSQMIRYGDRLAPMVAEAIRVDPDLAEQCGGRGAPVDTRFDDLDLIERENSYGRTGFAMQFMLDPSYSDQNKFPLKLEDLVVMDCNPEMAPIKVIWARSPELAVRDEVVCSVGMAGDRLYRPMWYSRDNFVPYTGAILAIDPAGKGKDELGYAVIAMLNGYLYLLKAKGLKGGYADENLKHLAEVAKAHKVTEVFIESNFGGGMFAKLLEPHLSRVYPCRIEEEHSSVQKEKRIIDTLEPVMNQHRLVVDTTVLQEDQLNYNDYGLEDAHKYQLFYQMTRITREKGALAQDDRLDAVALGVARWVELLGQDTEAIMADHEAALKEAAIEAFMEAAGARAGRGGIAGEFFGADDLVAFEFGV